VNHTKNGGRNISADLCAYELQASNRQDTKHKTRDHLPGGNPVTVIDPSEGEIYSISYYKWKRREKREDEEEEGEDQ